MQNDPYSRIYQAMAAAGREAVPKGALYARLGTVLAAEPLRVDVAGTPQEAERFYLADRLRKGHKEAVSATGSLAVSASCSYGSHSSAGVGGGALTVTNTEPVLKAGDLVLLLTEDDQTFYLIDKVVRLT